MNNTRIFDPLRGFGRRELSVPENFREPENRVERRAQFVAHVREQPVLQRDGERGFGACGFKSLPDFRGDGNLARDR